MKDLFEALALCILLLGALIIFDPQALGDAIHTFIAAAQGQK